MIYCVEFIDKNNDINFANNETDNWYFCDNNEQDIDCFNIIDDLLTKSYFPPLNIYTIEDNSYNRMLYASTSKTLDLSKYNENNPINARYGLYEFKFYLSHGGNKIIVELKHPGIPEVSSAFIENQLKNYFTKYFPVIYNRYYGFKIIINSNELNIINPYILIRNNTVIKRYYPNLYKFNFNSKTKDSNNNDILIYDINNGECIYNIPNYKNIMRAYSKLIENKLENGFTNPVIIRYYIDDEIYIDCEYNLQEFQTYGYESLSYNIHLNNIYYNSDTFTFKIYDKNTLIKYPYYKSQEEIKKITNKSILSNAMDEGIISKRYVDFIKAFLNKLKLPKEYVISFNNDSSENKTEED